MWNYDEVGSTDEATKELNTIFPEQQEEFQTPKPTRLIRRLLQIATTKDREDIVLDFFAGSGTTAHSALEINQTDFGNRRYILVQLPEPTGIKAIPTIAEITKERIRRVIKKLNEADAGRLNLNGEQKQDRGFRVFKLAGSNFKPWNAQAAGEASTLEKQLELHINHILDDRSPEDILYELLLKSGFPLTTPVDKLKLKGKTVYSLAGGTMFICLEHALTMELIRAMAGKKPERVVCLDEGFAGNDQLKANAVQIFKTKGITSFKTV